MTVCEQTSTANKCDLCRQSLTLPIWPTPRILWNVVNKILIAYCLLAHLRGRVLVLFYYVRQTVPNRNAGPRSAVNSFTPLSAGRLFAHIAPKVLCTIPSMVQKFCAEYIWTPTPNFDLQHHTAWTTLPPGSVDRVRRKSVPHDGDLRVPRNSWMVMWFAELQETPYMSQGNLYHMITETSVGPRMFPWTPYTIVCFARASWRQNFLNYSLTCDSLGLSNFAIFIMDNHDRHSSRFWRKYCQLTRLLLPLCWSLKLQETSSPASKWIINRIRYAGPSDLFSAV